MILERLFNLKNRKINFILIIMMITIFCNYFVGCSTKNTTTTTDETTKETQKLNNNTTDEVVKEIKKSQNLTFTKVVYASKDRVILYCGIGLIVYDIINQQIYRAIDLKSIHMNLFQGDDVTIFKVKVDGSQILMYNELMYNKSNNLDDRYLYDIENDILEKTDIKEFTNQYDGMNQFGEINPYNDDHLKKYENMEFIDCINIDKSSICYLIHPRSSEETALLQMLIVNKDTNKDTMYTIFS
ncbi:hypothetical protein CLPUN_19900 [Clostridium puniceum]|uniref:Uncharacterized protein n=1 Tax=Clostridium puniceum TaxID=29367 RepID=A0A1S8TK74_9CLOT|nr:hypothetical protein [Clostridium puniceum]OOM78131.1 hypothetical protein CLPUN_19900 [Clostridium puniceum]